MGGGNNDEMGSHNRGQGSFNCPSSDTNTNPMSDKVSGMAMSSLSTYKPSNGADPFYASGWDPLVSLSQNQSFGGSSMVSQTEFANSTYPGLSSASHLVRYPSDSSFGELVPKLPCFGSGGFSEMVGSFGLSECGQNTTSGCPPNYAPNKEAGNERISTNGGQSQEDHQLSEEGGSIGASPDGKRRKRTLESASQSNPNKNVDGELQKDGSGDSTEVPREQDEKKQKTEQSTGGNLRGKQASKQTKDSSNSGDGVKDSYIHVRARRGQATNSHSLAERVRREKISERMRLLQELVPGCNKITGKAVMLEEIINYVQSLQQQVEFLSMKLSTVNPELNIDLERILSKDVLHSRGEGAAIIGFGPRISSSQPYPHGVFPGTMQGLPSAALHYPPLPHAALDTELQNLFQMGFNPNSANDSLGPNGRLKPEL